MNANEKNEQGVVVETVVENLLSTALLAVDEENEHTAEIEDESLKAALSAALQARGLVSCPPPLLAMIAGHDGWKETLRQRLIAICKAHKAGATYNIKISDLEIDEVKSVKNGNRKHFIPVDPHTAISKWASTIMSDSVDKTNRATQTVIPASNHVSFTLRGPSSRRPTLEISFDF